MTAFAPFSKGDLAQIEQSLVAAMTDMRTRYEATMIMYATALTQVRESQGLEALSQAQLMDILNGPLTYEGPLQ